MSQNPRISAFGGNPSSYVQAAGSGNTPSVLSDWQPYPVPVPGTLVGQKSSASMRNPVCNAQVGDNGNTTSAQTG